MEEDETTIRLSPARIEEMKNHYEQAIQIMEDFEKQIEKLLKKHGDQLCFGEDSFEALDPGVNNDQIMRWNTIKGGVIVKKDGLVEYIPRQKI